jgi:hypothetical protein
MVDIAGSDSRPIAVLFIEVSHWQFKLFEIRTSTPNKKIYSLSCLLDVDQHCNEEKQKINFNLTIMLHSLVFNYTFT